VSALLLAFALLQAAAPPPPQWRSLGTFEGIETAYDPASVAATDGRVRVRTRGVIEAAGADGIRTVTGTTEIDCAAGTATAIDAKGYDAHGGLMLNAIVPAADRQAEPIRPGSPNAAVRAAVCGGG
jgi:hypothetical protein